MDYLSAVQKQQKDRRIARKSSTGEGPGSSTSSTRHRNTKSGKPDHIRNSAVHDDYMESHVAGVAMQPAPASLDLNYPAKKRMDRFVEVRLCQSLSPAVIDTHCGGAGRTSAMDIDDAVTYLTSRGLDTIPQQVWWPLYTITSVCWLLCSPCHQRSTSRPLTQRSARSPHMTIGSCQMVQFGSLQLLWMIIARVSRPAFCCE
jgi:hypothetical protein